MHCATYAAIDINNELSELVQYKYLILLESPLKNYRQVIY